MDPQFAALTLLRYSAYALPRHLGFGNHDINQGQDVKPTEAGTEKLHDAETDVMEKLLCDAEFIRARTQLLGVVPTKLQQWDESAFGEADKTLMRAIRAIRIKDINCLPATIVHLKDVEYFYEAACEHVDGEGQTRRYVRALSMWRHNLLRLCGGEDASSSSHDNLGLCGMQGSCMLAAKYLLSSDDAWSMNDVSEESVQSKKSSRSRKSRHKSIDPESVTAALSVDISQLKTELSIGRSILSLAKFAQSLTSKRTCAQSILQGEIAACLRDAIDVLSGISRTLQLIMSIGDLEEDDISDSITAFGGAHTLHSEICYH